MASEKNLSLRDSVDDFQKGFEAGKRAALLEQHESQKNMSKKQKKEDDNLNMRAAIIHIIGDMVQSIGVISAAIIIKVKPEWKIADPICTYLFSILVLLTTVPIFCECVSIVMEAAPDDVDTVELFNEIQRLKTVEEVHDFHCWALGGGKNVMTCHVRSDFGDRCIRDINRVARNDFGIYHTTV